MHLQRPARRPAPRAAAAADAPAPQVDYEEHFEELDDDELVPLQLEDDEPDVQRNAVPAAAPGFTEFGEFSRDFGPCPRVERMVQGQEKHWGPEMRNFHMPVNTASNYDYFMHFFDHEFFVNEMFAHTKAASPSALITLDELWTYLALRLILACYTHHVATDFFLQHDRDHLRAAPYLGDYMKFARFKQINAALRTCPEHDAGLPDKFFRVRKMCEMWQQHQDRYGIKPGYLNVTDESMMEFLNRTCPGWQWVERKPKPYGNLFHTAACAFTAIIFSLELFEGKDRPLWKDPPEFEDLFNTNAFNKSKVAGLMVRMAKPLFNTNSVLVHDSGFQSIPGMQELWKRGVFPSCLMKKKAHFARFSDGAANENFIKTQQYLVPFCKKMKFEVMPWRVIAHRDTKHLVQLLTTYGTSDLAGAVRYRYHPDTNAKMTFQYSDAVNDYFIARGGVDRNNNLRQGGLSVEQGWQTTKWHIRMFAFLVGVSESNAKLAADHFRDVDDAEVVSLFAFRLSVAQHILTLHAAQARAPARKASRELRDLRGEHNLSKIPAGCGRYTGKRDREHVDGFRKLPASREGHKWQCQVCKCGKQIRTYCLCNPAQPLCIECYAQHHVELHSRGE